MLTWLRRLTGAAPGTGTEAESEAGSKAGSGAPTAAEPPAARKRVVEVGWLITAEKATFVFDAPRQAGRKGAMPENAKAVGVCPAVIDTEARLYEVLCPIDLSLRIGKNDKGQPFLANTSGQRSTVATKTWQSLVQILPAPTWSAPNRPLIRFKAPWRFVADEPVWMLQTAPFNHYQQDAWPGVVRGTRLPIHIWPRSLTWTFEWHQTGKELVLKRGEPWFYLRFEIEDPSRPIRLIEAEATPELQEYCSGLERSDSFVEDSEALLEVAAARRPAKLLKKKARA